MKRKDLGSFWNSLFNKRLNQIKKDPMVIKDLKNLAENELIYAVKMNPEVIRFLDDPSRNVKMAAIQKDPYSISYIKNQTEEDQLAALKQDPDSIKAFIPISEKVQIAAVNADPQTISYFSATESVKLEAVRNDPFQILDNIEPSKTTCQAALEALFGDIGNITHCHNFIGHTIELLRELKELEINYNIEIKGVCNETEVTRLNERKVQKTVKAIDKIWPGLFQSVFVNKDANPSEYFKLLAVKSDTSWIAFIDNPSTNIQLTVINKDPHSIIYLKNPSEDIQLSAIKLDPYCVGSIKGLTDKAASEAKEYINASENRKFEALSVYSGNIDFINNPSNEMFEIIHKKDPYYFVWLTNKEFIQALENKDFIKIVQLKEEGYRPSDEAMQMIFEVTPKEDIATVQKIYDMNTMQNIKLASSCPDEKKTEHPLNINTLNNI